MHSRLRPPASLALIDPLVWYDEYDISHTRRIKTGGNGIYICTLIYASGIEERFRGVVGHVIVTSEFLVGFSLNL